ncbi:T9SS type A sorting domain-containing protein, partial [Niastella caeni]
RTHWLYFGDDARTHIQLFPNPASDQITIQLSRSLSRKATVKLVSYQGQVLHAYELNNIGQPYKLKLPTLAKGVYLVLIEGEEIREHVKLMIQ